ncbi:hypothetical protein CLOM_g13661 [Closterium sp. NIES-68]|nr:hypothetical protein CLOM_g13661 [Closterium sp. NIES-68]GJP85918.1 hypothetical protein CLOP_g16010 [Closterium sp. NIES-67]
MPSGVVLQHRLRSLRPRLVTAPTRPLKTVLVCLLVLLSVGSRATLAEGSFIDDVVAFFQRLSPFREANAPETATPPVQSPPVQSPPVQPPVQPPPVQSPPLQSPAPASAPGPEPGLITRYPTAWSDTAYLNTSAATGPKSKPPAPTLEPAWERFGVCSGGKGPFRVTITPRRIGTTWKGWGTSLAWLGNYIGGFPKAAMDPLLDLMFLPSGLGLNIVRFNIGAGSLPQYSPQLHSDALLRWRAMPGYWPAHTGQFNWTADSRQQAVLLGAKARGANVFEAFSNSPPWWMTQSKDVAGAKKAFQTNLQKRYEGRFAKYLVDVVERFKTDPALGNIEFDTLEPFNEALEGQWIKGMGQEGCNFNVPDMTRIIFKTRQLLEKRKLKTKLVGVDSFPGITALWFPLLLGKSFFHRINVHGYTLPLQNVVNMTASVAEKTYSARYIAMNVLAKSLGKNIWVSESGPLNKFGSSYDLSLYMMRNVIESVNLLEVSAYVYWQIFDPNEAWTVLGLNWYYPPDYTGTVDPPTKLKRFWMFKQFTDLVRPGSRPLLVPRLCRHTVAAFYSNQGRTVSVFIVNQRVRDKVVNVVLSRYNLNVGGTTQALIRRTTYGEDNAESTVEIQGTSKPKVSVLVEGQTFVSVTFTHVQRTRWPF